MWQICGDYDILQQRNNQINIHEALKTYVSREDIRRYYRQRSPAVQAVQEHKAINKPSEVLMNLTLKWLTEKPIWVKQWPLTESFKTVGTGKTSCSTY